MADFKKALDEVLKHEGGYVNDHDDSGGETYKGISRNNWPKWTGWTYVDAKEFGSPSLQKEVEAFYRKNFWDEIKGDDIKSQIIATSIFDFAVNAGVKTSVVLAQYVVRASADGIIGGQTISLINSFDEDCFLSNFAIAKIARYIHIVKKHPTNKKYFFGWVCRTLGE